jgi:site-specific DNA recombinase
VLQPTAGSFCIQYNTAESRILAESCTSSYVTTLCHCSCRRTADGFEAGEDPAGRMLFQLLGSFAEFERTTMHGRINDALERRAARGEWTGGAAPFGYRKEHDETFLRPDPVTASIVAAIFTRYVQTRDGARTIASWLDSEGIRTRNGAHWAASAVLDLLRRRTYIGEVSFRGEWRAGTHEPIIDRELFDAAQAILDGRAASPAVRRSNPADYLFSTLSIVCDRCGHPMVGASAHGRSGKRYPYYTCSTRARRGPTGCDQERLPKDELEEAILADMAGVYADTSLVAAALDEAQAEARARDTERTAERRRLETHAAQLRRKLDRYVAGFEAGELRASFLQSHADALQTELEAVEIALAQEPPVEAPTDQVDVGLVSWALSEALGGVLAARSPRVTRELLRVLIKEIRVVSPQDIRPVYRVPPSEVRILEDLVELQGLEPWTSCMPCRRSSS